MVTRTLPGWKGRPYELLLPEKGSGPVPVVVVFHGFTHDALKMRSVTSPDGDPEHPDGMDGLARGEGFALVYPNGTRCTLPFPGRAWNAGGGSRGFAPVAQPAVRNGVDDVRYFRALLADLETLVQVGPVFLTGISNGAAMAQRLAVEVPDRVAAVAAVAGGNQFSAATGRHSGPMPLLHIHGTRDPIWPYHGVSIPKLGRMVSVPDSLAMWGVANACGPAQVEALATRVADDPTRVVREVRSGQAVTELWRIEGGGHTWPGGHQFLSRRMIGPVCRHFRAHEVIWNFFQKFLDVS